MGDDDARDETTQVGLFPAPDAVRPQRASSIHERVSRDTQVHTVDFEVGPGTAIGEFRIEGKIGEGAMGTVFSAVHPLIAKHAAIKILNIEHCQDATMIARFVDEARVVNQIGHPNIVDVFAFGEMPDGRSYFAMERLRGETLRQRLRRGVMSLRETAHVIRPLARALEAAHDHEVVHRDLKPENVFLVEIPNDDPHVKLLDFGIAKLGHDKPRIEAGDGNELLGTPMYISPEQARQASEVGPMSDVYSLGAIAFELLTGRTLFPTNSTIAVVTAHLTEMPVKPSSIVADIPDEIDQLVLAMLAKDPADRPSLRQVRQVFDLVHDPAEVATIGKWITARKPEEPAQVADAETDSEFSVAPEVVPAVEKPATAEVAPLSRRRVGRLVPLLIILVAGGIGAAIWFALPVQAIAGGGGVLFLLLILLVIDLRRSGEVAKPAAVAVASVAPPAPPRAEPPRPAAPRVEAPPPATPPRVEPAPRVDGLVAPRPAAPPRVDGLAAPRAAPPRVEPVAQPPRVEPVAPVRVAAPPRAEPRPARIEPVAQPVEADVSPVVIITGERSGAVLAHAPTVALEILIEKPAPAVEILAGPAKRPSLFAATISGAVPGPRLRAPTPPKLDATPVKPAPAPAPAPAPKPEPVKARTSTPTIDPAAVPKPEAAKRPSSPAMAPPPKQEPARISSPSVAPPPKQEPARISSPKLEAKPAAPPPKQEPARISSPKLEAKPAAAPPKQEPARISSPKLEAKPAAAPASKSGSIEVATVDSGKLELDPGPSGAAQGAVKRSVATIKPAKRVKPLDRPLELDLGVAGGSAMTLESEGPTESEIELAPSEAPKRESRPATYLPPVKDLEIDAGVATPITDVPPKNAFAKELTETKTKTSKLELHTPAPEVEPARAEISKIIEPPPPVVSRTESANFDDLPGEPTAITPMDIPAESTAPLSDDPTITATAIAIVASVDPDDADRLEPTSVSAKNKPAAAPAPAPAPAAPVRAAAIQAPARPLPIITPKPAGPPRLGRYLKLNEIARGPGGPVFRGHDETHKRDVRIEALPPNLDWVASASQVTSLAKMDHPNLIRIYELIAHAGKPYLVTDPHAGKTLDVHIVDSGVYPWLEAVGVMDQVCAGLEYAHGTSMLHRAICPAVIVLHPKSAKLSGFAIGPDLQSPAYVAPDVIAGGRPDKRSDVYAIGATLFQCLTGRAPGTDHVLANVPLKLQQLVDAMLAPPGDRPTSVAEVRSGFKRLLDF